MLEKDKTIKDLETKVVTYRTDNTKLRKENFELKSQIQKLQDSQKEEEKIEKSRENGRTPSKVANN